MESRRKIKRGPKDRPPFHDSNYPPMAPFYQTPYYPAYELPSDMVNKVLPTVPFSYRPLPYKIAIGLLIAGVVLCLLFSFVVFSTTMFYFFTFIFVTLFMTIAILGIISIVLLLIPRRIGWYMGLITAFFGLIGLGLGTLIAIFTVVALLWPSTRLYFKTGQVWQTIPMMPYPYPPPPKP